jgi:hypothetical protein
MFCVLFLFTFLFVGQLRLRLPSTTLYLYTPTFHRTERFGSEPNPSRRQSYLALPDQPVRTSH